MFMVRSRSSSRILPLAALALATGIIAAAVNRLASPVGGLKITREGDGYGRPEIQTGSLNYPREAVDSDLFRVRIATPPRRIVSQYWSTDEYLYSVVPPERIVAVSEIAYQRGISNVYQLAERFHPVIATDPEKVLQQNPDLMVVSNSARIDFCDLVRTTGIPIYRAFTMFTTLEQVAETIRLTGYLTGEDAAAAKETARFWSEIRRAQARKPANAPRPRILGLGGRYSYGDETLFHDIVTKLGGINVGAEGGLHGYDSVNTEQIVRWNPEWIIAGANPGNTKEVLERMLQDPGIAITQAAKKAHIVVVENTVFLSMSPFTTQFVNAIAEAIYG